MRAERDSLLSEKELSTQTSTEEMEKLLCRVTSVSKERDELQEILEGLRQEKQQLQAELEDRVETVCNQSIYLLIPPSLFFFFFKHRHVFAYQ